MWPVTFSFWLKKVHQVGCAYSEEQVIIGAVVWWDGLVGWFGGMVWWDGLVGWFGGMVWWDGLVGWFGGMVWWDGLVGWFGGRKRFE